MPGDSQSLTILGVGVKSSLWWTAQCSTKRKFRNAYTRDSKSYQVRLQVSYCVHPAVPSQGSVQGIATAPGRGFSIIGPAKRKPYRRRSSDVGSRSYTDFDPTEIVRGTSGRFYQGQVSDPHRPHLFGKTQELYGSEFLNSRLWRHDRRSRQGDDLSLHQTPRGRRSTSEPNGLMVGESRP